MFARSCVKSQTALLGRHGYRHFVDDVRRLQQQRTCPDSTMYGIYGALVRLRAFDSRIMSDGRRQGVPESSSLSGVPATEKQMPSAPQPRLTATTGSSQPVNNDKRNKDPGLHEQDNDSSSSDDDDDPLLQELKEELEQRTHWDSNLSKQQQQQTGIHQPSSRQSYDARIA